MILAKRKIWHRKKENMKERNERKKWTNKNKQTNKQTTRWVMIVLGDDFISEHTHTQNKKGLGKWTIIAFSTHDDDTQVGPKKKKKSDPRKQS